MQERGNSKNGTFAAKQASRYQGDCTGLAISLMSCGKKLVDVEMFSYLGKPIHETGR
jgi:hypothetical protein